MYASCLSADGRLCDDFDLWHRQIHAYQRDFLHYRSHLAQTEDEGLFDSNFYENLEMGEAVVIMDFKMKILSGMFRQTQTDWYGQRGFSCLGVLILMPSETNADGHEATYHLFFSGDTTQDAEYVNTVKEYVYTYILPEYEINKVHFRCDGAGCFVAAAIKAEFAHWEERTGVIELSYKNNVPGKGKNPLDGQFGMLSQGLNNSVNSGQSFENEEELYKMCKDLPLENTFYHLLSLDRSKLNFSNDVDKAIAQLKLGRKHYLLTNTDDSVFGFTHSRHGLGESIPLLKGM